MTAPNDLVPVADDFVEPLSPLLGPNVVKPKVAQDKDHVTQRPMSDEHKAKLSDAMKRRGTASRRELGKPEHKHKSKPKYDERETFEDEHGDQHYMTYVQDPETGEQVLKTRKVRSDKGQAKGVHTVQGQSVKRYKVHSKSLKDIYTSVQDAESMDNAESPDGMSSDGLSADGSKLSQRSSERVVRRVEVKRSYNEFLQRDSMQYVSPNTLRNWETLLDCGGIPSDGVCLLCGVQRDRAQPGKQSRKCWVVRKKDRPRRVVCACCNLLLGKDGVRGPRKKPIRKSLLQRNVEKLKDLKRVRDELDVDIASREDQTRLRQCLKCQGVFESTHFANRICKPCVRKSSGDRTPPLEHRLKWSDGRKVR